MLRKELYYRLKDISSAALSLAALAGDTQVEEECIREDLTKIEGMLSVLTEKKIITEVLTNYTDPDSNCTCLDACFAEDDGEVAQTVAVVCRDSGKVISFGPTSHFLNDPLVQEAIKEVLKDLKVKKDEVWPEPSFMVYMEGGVLQSVTSLKGNRNLTYVHIDKDNIQCEEGYEGPFDQYMLHRLKNEPDTFLVKVDGTLDNASQYFES